MHRLFVALRPPPAIRTLLASVQHGVPHARWQDDDQLHLTIRYIGEVERPVAEDVALAIGQIHAAAPTIALAGVGAFDRKARIDALWAGVTQHEALAALHRKVDQALVRIGLEPERRAYLPHITLARLPRTAGADPAIDHWRADHAGLSSETFTPDALILYESRLGRDGASYHPIAHYPLEAADPMDAPIFDLRPWSENDRHAFAAMQRDPAVMADLGGPFTRAASDAKFDRYRDAWSIHGISRWVVADPAGDFLGYSGVMWRGDTSHPLGAHYEIGWRFRRDAWGRGYATESARRALDHAWTVVAADEILSYTAADNQRSRNVMERLNLKRHAQRDFTARYDRGDWAGLVWTAERYQPNGRFRID